MQDISPLSYEAQAAAAAVHDRYWATRLNPPRKVTDEADDGKPRGHVAIGLDLGFSVDHSALCAVEAIDGGDDTGRVYAVRKLERWPLRSEYQDVIERTVEIYKRLRAKGHTCVILCDIGGARGVWEMLRDKGVNAYAVNLIGSGTTRLYGSHLTIVKTDMAATLSILSNANKTRLLVPKMAKYARELKTELRNYEIHVSPSGMATFGAFANQAHDDLVSACGYALIYFERFGSASPNGSRVRWL
jgi:hypothetical protein